MRDLTIEFKEIRVIIKRRTARDATCMKGGVR